MPGVRNFILALALGLAAGTFAALWLTLGQAVTPRLVPASQQAEPHTR